LNQWRINGSLHNPHRIELKGDSIAPTEPKTGLDPNENPEIIPQDI